MICPRCQHVRPGDSPVPDWQCPACRVVYAKAAEAMQRDGSGHASGLCPTNSIRASSRDAKPHPLMSRRPPSTRPSAPAPAPAPAFAWRKWLAFAALAYGAWVGVRGSLQHNEAAALPSAEALRAIAAQVAPGDVVIYTTSTCPYCAQAKQWMAGHGFAYTECNVETDTRCERELMATGSRGVPTLRVRGRLMLDGFDAEELVGLLQ